MFIPSVTVYCTSKKGNKERQEKKTTAQFVLFTLAHSFCKKYKKYESTGN
jgi:hypothetical protein